MRGRRRRRRRCWWEYWAHEISGVLEYGGWGACLESASVCVCVRVEYGYVCELAEAQIP